MLASAGVGTLTLCDNDVVELTNLQRQIVHDIDSPEPAHSRIRRALWALNPDVRVRAGAAHGRRCAVEAVAGR